MTCSVIGCKNPGAPTQALTFDQYPKDPLTFCQEWRKRILDGKNGQNLPDEKFGQLLTLNTIIAYLTEQ